MAQRFNPADPDPFGDDEANGQAPVADRSLIPPEWEEAGGPDFDSDRPERPARRMGFPNEDGSPAEDDEGGTTPEPTKPEDIIRPHKVVGREFTAEKYLSNLSRGAGEYLEVKWRLLWLRTEQPEAVVETALVKLIRGEEAVFKAKVTLPSGASATGWGSESVGDFRDFLEKAETKAIGRALAALGFGTQFAADFTTTGDSTRRDRPADAPVGLRTAPGPRRGPSPARREPSPPAPGRGGGPPPGVRPGEVVQPRSRREAEPEAQMVKFNQGMARQRVGEDTGHLPATERQHSLIKSMGREAGLQDDELQTWSDELYGRWLQDLDRRQASDFIEKLTERRNGRR